MTSAEVVVPEPDLMFRLTIEQYHGMIDAGVLTRDDPVELLDGFLVRKVPEKPPHRLTLRLLQQALKPLVPAGWFLDTQAPITADNSEPEPDIAVFRGSPVDYADRHPQPGDVALAVEVSSSSLVKDRKLKRAVYARNGIPAYWIVNLKDRCIEIHTGPVDDTYSRIEVVEETGSVEVEIGGTVVGRINVAAILN